MSIGAASASTWTIPKMDAEWFPDIDEMKRKRKFVVDKDARCFAGTHTNSL